MLGAAIIVFREVIEAGLIVGIVLAATEGVLGRIRYVSGGIAAGVLGASLLALFAGTLSSALEGMGQEVFSASILAVAVVMLAWHNIWMASHGRELAAELKAAGHAVATGRKTLLALAAVVGIAVLREGAEVVLFLYGNVLANDESNLSHTDWRLFRPRGGRRAQRLDLCGPRHHPVPLPIQRNELPYRLPGRGHGLAMRPFPRAGRHRSPPSAPRFGTRPGSFRGTKSRVASCIRW